VEAPRRLAADPRARRYVIDHLAPGATIRRRFEVVNGTDRPARLHLYAGAATIVDDRFTFFDGRTPNELTSWTTITPGEVLVPPCGSATPRATIKIPERAHDGERYAVVWAERPSAPSKAGGFRSTIRAGIRLYLSVGTGREPAFDFTIKSLRGGRDRDGRPFVTATVFDVGGRAVDLSGEVRLEHGPGGTMAGPYPAERGLIFAPGHTGPVIFMLDPRLQAGRWTAAVVLRSGRVVRRAKVRITIPERRATLAGSVQVPGGDSTGILVGVALGSLGGLLGMVLLGRIRRRRPRGRVA